MIKRGRFYIAAAFITVVAGVVACTLTAVEQSDSIDIIKSDNDHRDYKLVVLSNRLRVLLISDSSTDKAAASLDVYVGSRQDPQTRQGLAHFLEHMLFLGTSKYPQAGEYQAFINKHNGSHNAYTSFEHTNYFFDLDPVYLDEALDRFSQFFISPLLTEAYVEREKNAVHSEYRAKIKSEQRKGLDVFKSIINPKHPFAKFSVGNLETLANVKGTPVLRDQLLAFYNTHYSANVMTLVVMGRESIEDLEVIVSEKFSAIPNTDKRIDAIEEPLFSDGSLPLYVTVKAEKDQRVLSIMFPTEEEMPYFQQKPMYYLGNIIGHEGQGSLLSYLKKRGWAESLSAGPGLSYKGGGSFSIAIALTEKGLIKSDQVIRAVFQAINRVEDSVAASWLFNEQAMLAQQQFRYLERSSPSSYVSGVATNLHYYPAAQVLSGAYLMSDFDSPLITHFLSYLNPDNAVVTLNAPDVAVDTVSPFYATQYQSKGVSKKTLNEWNDVGLNPLITLPKPNEFIVDNVELKNSEETELLPLLITNDAGLRVWFKHDDDFQIPKGSVFVNLRSSLANDSVEHSVLLSLFASMLSDELNEFSYPAILAGLNYSVGKNQRGLSVKISGFNDKQTLLLDKILAALTSFSFDSQRFDNIKQEHIRQLANAKKQQPYRLLMSQLNEILYRNKWSNPQLLSAYKKTSVQDLQAYAKLLLSDMTIDVLVHGNYLEVEAKQLEINLVKR
ncbi:MAG: insulinase family protein [Spongiibacteraceae bacterium]|nr:insulinase family protein [Spongiibacteraceae bacterium]